jgi:ABC-type nitrate/sulfonate/bicarbonate transport system permease component
MSTRMRRGVGGGLEIGVPVALLAAWALTSSRSASFYFPPLSDVLDAFRRIWLFDRVGTDVVPSLTRMAAGYALAAIVGVLAGLVLGRSRRARLTTGPTVEFLRATPATALIPLAIVVLGTGAAEKVFVIAFVCVWPILLSTIAGAAGIDPVLRDTARTYGICGGELFRRVVLPAASPQIFAGLRTSLPLALIVMVVSEMVASTNGIGYFVVQSQTTYAIPEMWAGILLLSILGVVLNAAFMALERRALAWHRGARGNEGT